MPQSKKLMRQICLTAIRESKIITKISEFNCILSLGILMKSSIWFDTIHFGWSIVHMGESFQDYT